MYPYWKITLGYDETTLDINENKWCFALPFSRIVVILQARNKIPMNNIKRIVLTGGPCAGKTTAQVRIVEHFSNLGFKVFTVPEVPTRNHGTL